MKKNDLFVTATPISIWHGINSASEGLSLNAACWCGAEPGSCPDCQDCDAIAVQCALACGSKVNIGSGEDNDFFR